MAQSFPPVKVGVNWAKPVGESKTTATLQDVVNPPLCQGSAIHDAAWNSLRELKADSVRFVPWYPYPRLGVAELQAPSATLEAGSIRLGPHGVAVVTLAAK